MQICRTTLAFAPALVLCAEFIASPSVAQQLPRALQVILDSEPLSCANTTVDYLSTTACKEDVGAYQLGRLSLSVEMFSSLLSDLQVEGSAAEIQAAVYADIGTFGLQAALVGPAMGLADLSSLTSSPYGAKSPEVFGKAMLSLEHLYPGLAEKSGLSVAGLAAKAELQVSSGPVNFSEFVLKFGTEATQLDSLRIVGSPSPGKELLLSKLAPSGAVVGWDNFNAAADFYFTSPTALKTDRKVPIGTSVTGLGGWARAIGVPYAPGIAQSETLPANDRFADTLFGGAGCLTCNDGLSGGLPTFDPQSPPMLERKFDMKELAPSGTGVASDAATATTGQELMQAELGAVQVRGEFSPRANELTKAPADAQGTGDYLLDRGKCAAHNVGCAVEAIGQTVVNATPPIMETLRDYNPALERTATKERNQQHGNEVVKEMKGVVQTYQNCVSKCPVFVAPGDKKDDKLKPEPKQTATNTNDPKKPATPATPEEPKKEERKNDQLPSGPSTPGDSTKMTTDPNTTGDQPQPKPPAAPDGPGRPEGPQQCLAPGDPKCGCDVNAKGSIIGCFPDVAANSPRTMVDRDWTFPNRGPDENRMILATHWTQLGNKLVQKTSPMPLEMSARGQIERELPGQLQFEQIPNFGNPIPGGGGSVEIPLLPPN